MYIFMNLVNSLYKGKSIIRKYSHVNVNLVNSHVNCKNPIGKGVE